MATIVGITARHRVITPECRRTHGSTTSFKMAMCNLEKEFEKTLRIRGEDGARYHLTLTVDAGDKPPEGESCLNLLARLEAFLHSRCTHPDYEYATTDGPRKSFDQHPPEGEGWEVNVDEGRDGWERFDYHEESYWRRKKTKGGSDA